MRYWCLLFICCPLFFHPVTSRKERNQTAEERLLRELFKGYQQVARPVYDASQAVQVEVDLGLNIVHDLDAKYQKLTVGGWIELEWLDERLTWNTSEYGHVDSIVVPSQMVWVPKLALENSVGSAFFKDHYELYDIKIFSDGWVSWEVGGYFTTSCPVDIVSFPFDQQVCELVFANWATNALQVNFTNMSGVINLEAYTPNVEWDVMERSIFRVDRYYDCCTWPYSEVHFRLKLGRKPLFFTINIIIPSVSLSVMALLMFCLPPDSGEKISIGLTILLAYTVFSLMVSEWVPRTSQGVALITKYLLCVMMMTGIEVLAAVVTLGMCNRIDPKRPPGWLRRLACLEDTKCAISKNNDEETARYNLTVTDAPRQTRRRTSQNTRASVSSQKGYTESNRKDSARAAIELYEALAVFLERIAGDDEGDEANAQEEWKKIAARLDTCLFIGFLIALICITTSLYPL